MIAVASVPVSDVDNLEHIANWKRAAVTDWMKAQSVRVTDCTWGTYAVFC